SGGVRVDATFVKGERGMLGARYVVVRGDNLWRVAGGHRRRSGARQLIQALTAPSLAAPAQAFCLSSLSTRLSNSGYRRFARRRIGSYGANGLSRYRHAVGAAHPDRGRARDWLVLRRGFELPPLMFTDDEAEAIAVGVRFSRAP